VIRQKLAARKFAPTGLVFAALGLLLFVYFVKKAGVAEIMRGIERLGGAGLLLLLVVSSVRPIVRALCWRRCFEEPHRLRFRDALRAYLAGDALGTVMPGGIVFSEPAKAAFIRDRVPLGAAISSIALENLFYSLSVALFVFSGMVAVLLSFSLAKELKIVILATLGGMAVFVLVAYILLRRQWRFLSGAAKFLHARGIGSHFLETRRERISELEDRIYGFRERHPGRALRILLLEFCFHLAGVVEVYLTLHFISPVRPTWLAAFVLESVNRVINVVFKFVPLRVGVDEAGTGLFTDILKFGTGIGVMVAIIRKARVLFWAGVGMILLIRRGLRVSALAGSRTEENRAERAAPGRSGINLDRSSIKAE